MNMHEFIIIDIFEHFSFTFAYEALLLGIFTFLLFAEIAFPIFCFMKTGVVAVFMDKNFACDAMMEFEDFLSFQVHITSSGRFDFFLGVFGPANLAYRSLLRDDFIFFCFFHSLESMRQNYRVLFG